MPWNTDGLGPEAEAAARRAARQSGMSLADWLDHTVKDASGHDEADDAASLDDHLRERITALESELERLSANNSNQLSARLRTAVDTHSDNQSTPDRPVEENPAISAIENTIKDIATRIENAGQADRHTLARVQNRLDKIAQRYSGTASGEEMSRMKARTNSLVQPDSRIPATARPTAGSSPDQLPAQPEAPAAKKAPEPSKTERAEQSAGLLLGDTMGGPQSDRDFEMLAERLQEIRKRAGYVPPTTPVGADQSEADGKHPLAGTSHSARGDRRERPGPLKAPASVDQTNSALAGITASRSTLNRDMEELRQRVDTLISRELSDLRKRVETLANRDIGGLREHVKMLAQRLDETPSWARADGPIAAVEHRLDKLDGRLQDFDSRLSAYDPWSAPGSPMAEFDNRLGELARDLQNAVTQQQIGPQLAQLEAGIADISVRLDQDEASHDDGAVQALEQQVAALAKRLEAAEGQSDTIRTIEQNVTRLFASMETTRQSAVDAARKAATQVVQELGQGDTDAAISSETIEALRQGLDSVRLDAASTDKRTQQTLQSVQETLEKVIVRLSQIEASEHEDNIEPAPGQPPSSVTMPAMRTDVSSTEDSRNGPVTSGETRADRRDIGDLKLPLLEPEIRPRDDMSEPVSTDQPAPVPVPATPSEPATDSQDRREPPIGRETTAPMGAGWPGDTAAKYGSDRNQDFIAAARRAAQAAQMSAETGEIGESGRASAIEKGMHLLGRRKASPGHVPARGKGKRRPLLLAAVVLLMIGAYTTYTTFSGNTPAPTAPDPIGNGDTAPAPADPPAAPRATAPQAPVNSDANGNPGEDASDPGAGLNEKTSRIEPAQLAPAPSHAGNARSRQGGDETVKIVSTEQPAPGNVAGFNVFGSDPLAADPFVTGSLPPAADPVVPPKARSSAPVRSGNGPAPDGIGPEKLRRAAANGDPKAQFEIATRYLKGTGISIDYRSAAAWYQKAAAKGLAPAQYRLGTLYEKGRGVPQDKSAARIWYERAAEKGNRKAMHNLAVIYTDGTDGNRDLTKAAAWFRRAAEHGLTDSMFNLAVLHERGLGVSKDLGEAYKWFAIAADEGDKTAAEKQKQLEPALSPEGLVRAKLAVTSWKPKPLDGTANAVHPPEGGWGDATAETAAAADPSSQIAEVQRRLNQLGLAAGPADGILGARTRQAIRAFQTQIGFEPTGVITTELIDQLRTKSG